MKSRPSEPQGEQCVALSNQGHPVHVTPTAGLVFFGLLLEGGAAFVAGMVIATALTNSGTSRRSDSRPS